MFPQYVYSTAHDIFDRGCDMENPMSGGGLFLGETGLLPQTAEVGAYTIVLLYLLIHLSSSIN